MENKIYRDNVKTNKDVNYRGCEFYLYTGNEKYFQKVFSDAAISEKRTVSEVFFYGGFEDEFGIWVSNPAACFDRVRTKINYRLKNNKWIKKIIF